MMTTRATAKRSVSPLHAGRGSSAGACVLVVEGNPTLRGLYARTLTAEGYRVESVASGAQALQRMRHAPGPAAMVLELRLRDMDGLALLRQVLEQRPATAIVLHTTGESFWREFAAWGADGCVEKSSDLRALKAALADALAARARQRNKVLTPPARDD